MLVLSRMSDEQVVFPNLGITVTVLSVQGKRIKLGFDAPIEFPIVRKELMEEMEECVRVVPREPQGVAIDRHAIRNRLNKIVLAMHILNQFSVGDDDAAKLVRDVLSELKELDRDLESIRSPSRPESLSIRGENSPAKGATHALIVEDDDNERSLLAAYLRMRGYAVEEATDGISAIEYLKTHSNPDVVLVDMNMPRLNGAKMVSRIRHTPRWRDLRVFGVSGSERSQWRLPLGERGVDRWFCKPVDPESIVHEIDELVGV